MPGPRPAAASRPARRGRLGGVLLLALLLAAFVPPARAADPPAQVTLERIAGADRYGTAVAISQRLYPNGSVPAGGVPVVYLSSGETYADAVAAGPLAAHDHGVILLTPAASLPDVVATELTRLAPQRLVVLGGPTTVSDGVMALAEDAAGVMAERVAGADRYETAAAAVHDAFPSSLTGGDTIFLATGANFPDALSVGAAAGSFGAPVLLTRPDRLPTATTALLRGLAPTHVIIVGSAASVSDAVAAAVRSLGPTVERVAGADRYATAAAVARRFMPTATTDVLTSGMTFPDALAGVPLAVSLGAPILLTVPDAVPFSLRDAVIASRPSHLVTLGGEFSVRQAVPNELSGWSDGRLQVLPLGPNYPSYDSRYHNYAEMQMEIKATEAAYPGLVKVFSIGKSYQGRDIWAAKVSDNVGRGRERA